MKKLFFLVILVSLLLSDNSISLSPKVVKQGNSFKISLTAGSYFDSSKIFFDKKYYSFNKVTENLYEVIIGSTYDTEPKSYPVYIKLYHNQLLVLTKTLAVNIEPQHFEKSTLIISEQKEQAGATDWQSLSQENGILGKAFRAKKPDKYWSGIFAVPIKNYLRISSPYGNQRIYKNSSGKIISRWAHKGVDYSVAPGEFVYAANSGYIIVSKLMKVHGKTIVIDHGHGVQSTYNHLSQRFVKPGQYVEKGEVIGRSGDTGLTTGAHLHYGLSVNNVRVNPKEWFEREF